jgi:hypothetical protein
MTLLGKFLVFINLLLSFLMLSLAFALYTNRIDWSASPPKGDKPAGMLVARQERVKTASAALAVAGDRWREALNGFAGNEARPRRDGLPAWEKRLADDRVWYAAQLAEARKGPDGKGDKVPVKWVKVGPDGLPIPDPKNSGRPTLANAERRRSDKPDETVRPLYCEDWYRKEMTRLTQAIDAEHTAYQEQVKLATDLTQLAIGPKGLRQRIVDEQVKNARIKEEMRDVTGRQTNAEVETELLQSRREQLEARVGELKKEKK